jgi:hypothetical protein
MFGEYCIKDKTYTAVKCVNANIADGTLPKWTLMNDAINENVQPIDFRKIRPLGFIARARALRADTAQKTAFDEQFIFELFLPPPYTLPENPVELSWREYLFTQNGRAICLEMLDDVCRDENALFRRIDECTGLYSPDDVTPFTRFADERAGWQAGMRLEALDIKNPSMICVATITEVGEYSHQLRDLHN